MASRLPDQQPDPGVERPRLPGPVAGGARSASTGRTTSPSSPAASARRPARARARSASTSRRSRSRRSSTRSSTRASTRAGSRRGRRRSAPARRSRSSAPGRPASPRRPAQPRRPPRHRLRARRPHRRPADVRHPEHEARQGRRRAPGRAPGGRGGHVRDGHRGRPRRPGGRAAGRVRRGRAVRRARRAARDLAGRGPRARGHPPRDGVPAREHEEPARRRTCRTAPTSRREDQRRGRHRRRRHRHRLRRHGDAPGRRSVAQLEILPRPPDERAPDNPWPQWPKVYKLDYGQEEAAARLGEDPRHYSHPRRGASSATQRARDGDRDGRHRVGERERPLRAARGPGTEKTWPATSCSSPSASSAPRRRLLEQLGVELDARGNVRGRRRTR